MQTIDRNNYEEYFLLYVDGELDAASKLAVENFVQQNADLALELEMLLHTRFSPEAIEFADKDNLLRTEGNNINETNYEEYFLLYIDNELSAAKREEVETYVLQHPKLQDEFITLKQAVLTSEIISYGDKSRLYRTERKRAIYLKPWRLAAAAVFIGVCAIGLWVMQKPANVQAPVAVNNASKNQPEQNNSTVVPVDSIQQQMQQPKQAVVARQTIKKEGKKTVPATVAIKKKEAIQTGDKPVNNNITVQQEGIVIQPPVITHNNIAMSQKEPPVEKHGITDVPQSIDQKQNDIAALQAPLNTAIEQSSHDIYPVAYKEINTNDDDRSLHVGMLDLNKDRVRSLFKKAGRMFENKSNNFANEDGKLQVANFEIDTKK